MGDRLLYKELHRLDKNLADQLDKLYEVALEIWQEQHLRSFTTHGKDHISQVEANLDALTRPLDSTTRGLKAEEIYVLLAACYLHDIGMQLGVPDAREEHAQYSCDLILHSYDSTGRRLHVQLPIPDEGAREAIAQIARAHWVSYALKLEEVDVLHGAQKGRLRLLGALLAMADLLDLSPVRARYFRTTHRLYDLGPVSELHQKTHKLVRWCGVKASDGDVPGDLSFTVEWRNNGKEAQTISDWVLHWFTSQWRQLQPVLHRESGGLIRWASPYWAKAIFKPPIGPPVELSQAARHVLEAERSEQRRIDRNEFCQIFLEAIRSGKNALFCLPMTAEGDGTFLSKWCSFQPYKIEGVRVARIDVRKSSAPDAASLVAELVEQWGSHLREVGDEAALQWLKEFLAAEGAGFVAVIVAPDGYTSDLLDPLLRTFFVGPGEPESAPRVCALFTPGAAGPNDIPGCKVHRPIWTEEIREADLEAHLQQSWGYNKSDAARMVAAAAANRRFPGLLYSYVETLGAAWENDGITG